MDLVQVDCFRSEALEAAFELASQRVGLEAERDRAVACSDRAALGEEQWPPLETPQRLAHDAFGVAPAVGGGGVDPVDAELDCALDRRDGVTVVLTRPALLPLGAARGQRT